METDIPLPSPPRTTARDTRTAAVVPQSSTTNASSHLNRLGSMPPPPPSSDPPLFSSDDFQSSALENYTYQTTPQHGHTQGRGPPAGTAAATGPVRKRRYRGTWWGEQLQAKTKRKRTEFSEKRFVDSGVWLGSEDSNLVSSDDMAFMLSEAAGEGNVGDDGDHVDEDVSPSAREEHYSRLARVDKSGESEPHRLARAAIIRCLEDGNDNVDLSYFNMGTIPPGLLRPLVQLTKEPAAREPPLEDDVYTPLEPFLRLFLTRNLLSCLSGEVAELESLRVLSLRHNKLTEIPCAIRNLTMLQDLNVAGNRLEYLPWEVLHLMHTGDLRQLTVHPNPFLELDEKDIAQWHCHDERKESDDNLTDRLKAITYTDQVPPEAWLPIHVATSKTQYLDPDGRPLPNPEHSNTQQQKPQLSTSTPSLRELCLRACTRSNQLARIFDPDDPDDPSFYPDPIFRLLGRAKRVKDAGGSVCSVCLRPYVIPRTSWVEWWDCVTVENGSKSARKSGQELYPLPFLRRGCSLACGPGRGSGS